MIPRCFPIPLDHHLYQVRPQSRWAALLIAWVHQAEGRQTGEICQCRCCEWSRQYEQGRNTPRDCTV